MTLWNRACATWACRLGILPFLATAALAAQDPTIRLLRSDAGGATIEVTAPWPEVSGAPGTSLWSLPDAPEHWVRLKETGKPDLPVGTIDLGLPPGTRPVVTTRVIAERLLPGPEPAPVPRYVLSKDDQGLTTELALPARDDAAYAAEYPSLLAEAGEVGTLRHIRVTSLRFYPYHWDPAAQALRYVEKFAVEVRFEPTGSAEDKGLNLRTPGAEDASWERLYRSSLLNADQAVAWRRAPARWAASASAAEKKSYFDGPEMRIRVRRSDVYRVTQASLVEAGWNAGLIPVDQLALVERSFRPTDPDDPFHEQGVPIYIRDRNGDGAFGPGDDFLFFGLSAWDRWHPLPRDKRYGRIHGYYLSVREDGGARFAEAPSFLDQPDVPVNQSAQWSQHFEGDGTYMFEDVDFGPHPDAASDFAGALESIRNEHSYWVGGFDPGNFDLAFDLPGFQSALEFRVALQRVSVPSFSPTALVSLIAGCAALGEGQTIVGPLIVAHRETIEQRLDAAALADVPLCARNNSLRMAVDTLQFSCALDWFEWTWRRDLSAVNGRLAFSTAGQTGPQEYRLLNYGVADTTGLDRVLVFDLSDSARTEASAGPVRLTWRPDQYQGTVLRVQLDLGSSGRPHPILAIKPAAASQPAPPDLTLLDPSDPIYQGGYDLRTAPDGDEDLICIVHPDFAEGIEPLLAQRRAQGLVVRKVLTDQVYDQFGGGLPAPTAIRNYLRYLFSPAARTSAPTYLLLVGDASDDFTGVLDDSAPNYVPTQTLFSAAYSGAARDLVSCDYWYVDRLSDLRERFDFRPDMHVGRLPVGSTEELAAVVDKLIRYDHYSENDAFRARGLFVSDDEFSSTINFGDIYRFNGDTSNPVRQNGESRFRWAAWEGRRIIQEEAGFTEFACDSFFTAAYMDTVAGNWEYNGNPVDLHRCMSNNNACPTWSCPEGARFETPDSMYACYNNVSAPYVGLWNGQVIPYQGWWSSNYWYGRLQVSPILRQMLGRGFLFVNYQGHANARLLSHEYILESFDNLQDDTQNLANEDKPFVFFGFGCHLAEFSGYDEGAPGRGDCLVERMLRLDRGRGAIAALGSSGYEWINTTELLDLALFRAWFRDPPIGPEGRPRWVLGEIISQAKTSLAGSPGGRDQTPTYNLMGDPSMPLEMAPPRFEVYVNCTPGATGCEPYTEGPLRAVAEGDTAWIRSRLADENGIAEISIRDAAGVVDSSLYTISPDPLRPTDTKRRLLTYARPLDVPLSDYEILLQVRDGRGNLREQALPVSFGALFQVVQDGAPRAIQPDDVLEAGDSLRMETDLPIDVLPERLAVWLDDTPVPFSRDAASDLRRQVLRAVLPELTEGAHLLRLRVEREVGVAAERTASFLGPTSETHLLELYNFPNPFEDVTEVIYRLSSSAERARLTIFTSAGRKIWTAEGPAQSGRNAVLWDGRDADGDRVANGVYLYKLEISTPGGGHLRRIERMARIR